MPKYRQNVAAILRREDGRILICERIRQPGSWNFPQGGVDKGEEPEKAMLREVREEIGVKKKHLEVVCEKSGYRYKFSGGRIKWKRFRGQEQTYFLCDFGGKDRDIDIEQKHPEFRNWRWIKPKEFDLNYVPKFKRDVYRAVMNDFFDVKVKRHRLPKTG